VCTGLSAGITGIGAACASAHAGTAKAKPESTALASNRRISRTRINPYPTTHTARKTVPSLGVIVRYEITFC
jgi:hypothetical protein